MQTNIHQSKDVNLPSVSNSGITTQRQMNDDIQSLSQLSVIKDMTPHTSRNIEGQSMTNLANPGTNTSLRASQTNLNSN